MQKSNLPLLIRKKYFGQKEGHTVVLHQTNLDFFKKGQLQLGGQISRPIFRADSESAARFGPSWPALIEILRPKISSLAWPRSVVCTTSARVDAMRARLARNHGMPWIGGY